MNELLEWLLSPEHIFTLVTVILSGLLSWVISAIYFHAGNRNALRSNVMYPIKRILEDEHSWKNFNLIIETAKDYNSKYLYKKEQEILDNLLSAYKTICNYNSNSVCAESLFSYFCYELHHNGIEAKVVPLEVDGEIMGYDFPDDMFYMRDQLAEVIREYPPDVEEEKCLEKVKTIFGTYCRKCFSNKNVVYFGDYTLGEVLSKAHINTEWDKKFAIFKDAEVKFLHLNILKKSK